ncbi:MAG: 2-oxoacid:acceptor oxidoreductase family protein [Candidatus Hodarchaeota archaeon]
MDFPYPINPDIFIVMSKEAYEKNVDDIRVGATIFYDTELVELDERAKRAKQIYGIQSTKIAEELGVKIAANIVMLGFVSSRIEDIITKDKLKACVLDSVPKRFIKKNDEAFERGFREGEKVH